MKHIYGPDCPLCNEKLKQAHQELKHWYLTRVKPGRPDAHISWSYRGQIDQNKFAAEDRGPLYPGSKHNAVDESGKPCSDALDLFQQNEEGVGVWSWAWCKEIRDEMIKAGDPILWGGDFKNVEAQKRGDFDHFERMHSQWHKGVSKT